TELVEFRHLALALGAGRLQVAFAVGAEIEPRADRRAALRTRVGQRLAHQKIDNQADEPPGGQKNEDQNSPDKGVHSAAGRIAIDVCRQEDEGREKMLISVMVPARASEASTR